MQVQHDVALRRPLLAGSLNWASPLSRTSYPPWRSPGGRLYAFTVAVEPAPQLPSTGTLEPPRRLNSGRISSPFRVRRRPGRSLAASSSRRRSRVGTHSWRAKSYWWSKSGETSWISMRVPCRKGVSRMETSAPAPSLTARLSRVCRRHRKLWLAPRMTALATPKPTTASDASTASPLPLSPRVRKRVKIVVESVPAPESSPIKVRVFFAKASARAVATWTCA